MHRAQRVDPAGSRAKRRLGPRVVQPRSLHVNEGVDLLQVVLHTVVQLANQEVAVGDRRVEIVESLVQATLGLVLDFRVA